MAMSFVFEQVRVGGDRNFGYLLGDRDEGKACLIDPSYSPDLLVERAEAQGLKIELIINTHSHGDHTNGNGKAQQLTGAPVAAYQESAIQPDRELVEGQILRFGSVVIKVLYTPGHCSDHIVLYLPNQDAAITGDHLFVGKIGGTMTDEAAEQQFISLRRMVDELPSHTTLWPGHDTGCRPSSTMAWELATNPFLIVKNLDEFIARKNQWSEFKQEHGLL